MTKVITQPEAADVRDGAQMSRVHRDPGWTCERGFTLVELLVVVLVIGMLAAIALPVFIGQKAKGQDSQAKSDARNLLSLVQSCYAETPDYTECDSAAELGPTGLDLDAPGAVPAEGMVAVSQSGVSTFTVAAKSKSTRYFAIKKQNDGTVMRTCGSIMTPGGVAAGQVGGGCKVGHDW